ncbi:MAG: SLC13 family permease [Chloroflexota bacterium]
MGVDWTLLTATVIVVGTLLAMASGRVSPLLALVAGLSLAGVLGIATPAQLASGLSNPGVITVGAMLVIARGVVATGVVSRVTWLLLHAAESAQQAIRRVMVPIGLASAVMNTTPIVAMLIPATRELEQTRGIPARRILLPVAHVTTLAGAITLIGTSSNLLIAGIASEAGVDMGMLSFAPVALPVALVGWLVVYLVAPRLGQGERVHEPAVREWHVEIPVAGRALLLGHTARSQGLALSQEYELVAIERWGQPVDTDVVVEPGDVLVFMATEAGVRSLWGSAKFGTSPVRLYAVTIRSGDGAGIREFEDDAIHVGAARTTGALRDAVLGPGEMCFVSAPNVEVVRANASVGLWQDAASRVPQPGRTWVALGILAGVIVTASLGLVPVEVGSVAGAVLMVLTRVLTPGSAARALDLNVLGILAASVGLGAIVVTSGLADVIADGIRTLAGGEAMLVVLVFAVATTMLTNVTTNAATAAILTPIGLTIAAEMGIDPMTVLALIGTCVSFTFINPYSHQTNLMVMRPGGYTQAAFARFGVPVVLAAVATAIAAAGIQLRV